MNKLINLVQYALFLGAVILGLFVDWKIGVVLVAVMIVIALARDND